MAVSLKVNGRTHVVDVAPDTPLLYVLRDELELNAAKFGCGLAQCGACTARPTGRTSQRWPGSSGPTDPGSLLGRLV